MKRSHVKYTREQFIEEANKKYSNKFDYSLTVFKSLYIPVIIICPDHGKILQKPKQHLMTKYGCLECSGLKKMTTEEFIKRAGEIHDNKYSYNKSIYINQNTKTIITCPLHDDFDQTPS